MIDLRTRPSNIVERFCFIHSDVSRQAGELMGESKGGIMAEVKKITQTQLVKEIATATGITNKQAKAVLDTYVEIAIKQTKTVGLFVLPGIGRLKKVERKARTGRNPATGATIKIPAKKVVKLTLAKALKEAIVPPKPVKAAKK
jgi:DNA-binding protein HU-beta